MTADSETDALRPWNLNSQQEIASVPLSKRATWCVAFAPDGTLVATGGLDGSVRLWNATYLSETDVRKGHSPAVDAVASSPDGKFIDASRRRAQCNDTE